ncbi:uncharacterized protein LOC117789455 [Drosophila innubila]|uniref:uncharacterized protein LOC117789455 n=1 Tax=Drosophila innubila TaxID=198719 RepID=UPI00148E4642|nr:uncharacterized protein LOC117789455 [Drosophila innubila]
MMANRGYILIQLLLLLPNTFFTHSISLESGYSQINYLNDVIQNAIKERPADTLLLLKRRQDKNCLMKDFNPHHLIPTLRLDEFTIINVKDLFNSEAISLVFMSELADYILLTSLAKDLHRMRESRVIIWLQSTQSNLRAYLDIITEQASNFNFLSLIVLHSTSSDVNELIVAYRLQPFPRPNLKRISNLFDGKLFVKTWLNFNGKTAVILPDLIPPHSLLAKDIHTGKQKLYGCYDRLIEEFAKKYNISLRLNRPISEVGKLGRTEVHRMTINGELDLPIQAFVHAVKWKTQNVEYVSAIDVGGIFIVVPCAREMSIGDVYKGLRTYSSYVLGAYFLFAVLETLIVAATYRIIRRRYRFSYAKLFINLYAFCGVLGLPFPLARYRTSLSLQQMVMVMSIFSLIFSCFFNANLSTLLIKQPHYKQIESYEELRKSGLTVIFDERSYNYIINEIDKKFFNKVCGKLWINFRNSRNEEFFASPKG